jgi:hypothetical protein
MHITRELHCGAFEYEENSPLTVIVDMLCCQSLPSLPLQTVETYFEVDIAYVVLRLGFTATQDVLKFGPLLGYY